MSDAKAIVNICMVLPVSKEEVHQANIKIKSPHNWHDVATKIIKEFNNFKLTPNTQISKPTQYSVKQQANTTFYSFKNHGLAKLEAATEDHQPTKHGSHSSPYKPSVQVNILKY
jgi:hypothetical protein